MVVISQTMTPINMIDELGIFDDLPYGLVKKYVGYNRHPDINCDVFLKLGATFCPEYTINFVLVLEDGSEYFITKQYPNVANSVLTWLAWCDDNDEESDEESDLPPAQ